MEFFRSIINSLYNVEWLRTRFLFAGAAWGYFFLLSLILSVFSLVPVAISVPGALHEARLVIETKIPDFTATVKNGELEVTGITQPYSVSVGENEKNVTFYVNTMATSTFDAADFVESPDGGVVLVTKDKLEIYNAGEGKSQTFAWENMEGFSLTKKMVLDNFDRYTAPVLLPIVGLFILLVVYIGFVLAKLFSIFIVSVIVVIACKITGRGWRFAQLFTIGLYAFTLPALIALVVWFVGIPLGSIHFLSLLAFMLAIVFTRDRILPESEMATESDGDKKLDLEK